MMEGKSTWVTLLIVVASLCFGLYFFLPHFNQDPLYIHAWAQSDRYAIALGFLNNGFDFFHPQSFIYNHEYHLNYSEVHTSTITSMDFPLHEYLVAILMKLFGTTSPLVFRTYVFAISMLGIFSFIRIAHLTLKDHAKTILPVVVLVTSPLFIFAQSSFLVNVPSLSLIIFGLFLLLKGRESNQLKTIIIGLFFILLACLTRTTFVIGLLSVISVYILEFIQKRKLNRILLLIFAILIGLFMIHQWYKYSLKSDYGSIFVTTLQPADSINEFFLNLYKALNNWWNHYFTLLDYFLLGVLFILGVFYFLIQKMRTLSFITKVALIWIIGDLLFAIAMSNQLIAHNYYFLDTFFLPILMLLISALKNLPKLSWAYYSASILLLIGNFIFIQPVLNNYSATGEWDYATRTGIAYKDGNHLLDKLGVPKDAKILALNSYAPNFPFIGMQRTGYAVDGFNEEIRKNVLTWDYDYVTFQNNFFVDHIYLEYPEFINEFKNLGSNGKITVCKKRTNPANCNLLDFLQLNESNITQHESAFQPNSKWQHTDHPGNINTNESVGPLVDLAFGPNDELIYIQAEFDSLPSKSSIVLNLFSEDELVVFDTYLPSSYIREDQGYSFQKIYYIPRKEQITNGRFYISNDAKEEINYSKFSVTIYSDSTD